MLKRICVCWILLLLFAAVPASAFEEIFLPPIEDLPEIGTPEAPAAPAVDVAPAFGTGPVLAQPVPVVTGTEFARINWTDDYVEATGQAVAPTGREGTAQGKLLARRGATVDLQRNLLESIQGVRVDAQTTMTDFMATDVVRTQVEGLIRGVEIVEATWDGDVYTVHGRVKLDKVRTAVAPALPKAPERKPVPPTPKPDSKPAPGRITASGLVIDTRHLPLIPAMTFRVVDESGKEVYGLDFVDSERFLASGLCDYQTNLAFAREAPRVATAPIVAKAVRTVAPQNVDIVISNADAAKVRASTYDFRIPCRVSVVKR